MVVEGQRSKETEKPSAVHSFVFIWSRQHAYRTSRRRAASRRVGTSFAWLCDKSANCMR